MTRTLEHIDAQLPPAQELGRAALPPALAAAVDLLKVGESLLHALGSIEQMAWDDHLYAAESRASAFAVSAMIYGDLSHSDWDALDKHIRECVAARRALLQEKFSESTTNNRG